MVYFKKTRKPFEADFYTIFEDFGIKYIHIFGYSYKSSNYDYKTEDNPDGTYWANMECSWFIEPLADFVKHIGENENYVDDTYCELNQYQGDYDEAGMARIINIYFDGKPADAFLSFAEITEDTPCGNYMNKYGA